MDILLKHKILDELSKKSDFIQEISVEKIIHIDLYKSSSIKILIYHLG